MFDYFQGEFVTGPAEQGVACKFLSFLPSFLSLSSLLIRFSLTTFKRDYIVLKNAIVNLAAQLFVYTYPVIAPNFLSSMLSLLRTYPPSSSTSSPPPLNPQTTDLLLRLLHEISLEIGDAQLRLNKPGARLAKDTELRDAIRERDAPAVAGAVWEIIAEAVDGVERNDQQGEQGKIGLTGKTARDIGEMAVRVAGDYVCKFELLAVNSD